MSSQFLNFSDFSPFLAAWFVPRTAFSLSLSAFVLLLSWRVWKFSIVPALYPNDPKEFPYWVPFLGHSIGFFKNSHELLNRAREYFGDSREPFAVTVGGTTFYVLTSPPDVQLFFKNTSSLSWNRFVRDIYRWMGISPTNIINMWRTPTEKQKKANPKRKLAPNQMIEEYHSQQLLPGGDLENITKTFVAYIDDKVRLQSPNFDLTHDHVLEVTSQSATVDVFGWTTFTFVHALTDIYYGQGMLEIAPDLLKSFRKWERTNWKFMFQLPTFMSKDMHTAKDQLVTSFTTYFQWPLDNRVDANHFVRSTEEELRDCGLSDPEIARIQMLHHWAINGNLHKVTFWVLAQLVHDPALLATIRAESAPGVINNVPNVGYLTEQCPRLESIFYEVLRMQTSSSLMRFVTAPTVIGGKFLRPGNHVMAPYRQLHYNTAVWGRDAATFNPDRFFNDKSLSRNPSFRPFGGGVNLCPGRYLAWKVVSTFIALTLSRFEIELVGGKNQPFPRADLNTPAIATMSPTPGSGMTLRLTPRYK